MLLKLRMLASFETRAGRWTVSILAYTISFGFMLPLGNARFWDDWSSHFYDGTNFLSGQTFPFRQPLDDLLISASGGFWLYRPLTFAAFLACGWFVWKISEYPLGFLTTSERTAIVLLFLVLPFNSVRAIVQGLFSYTYSYFFFFFGWMIWVRQTKFLWFFAAWVCFVLSFPTHSLLFFAAAPALHLLVTNSIPLASRLAQIGILGITSLIFRPAMSLIRPDLQLNEGYNAILPAFLMRASLSLMLILAIATSLILKTKKVEHTETSRYLKVISAGLILFALGLFPYMAVGHFPNLSDLFVLFIPNLTENDSRHSLLLPIGTAVTVVGIARLSLRREALVPAFIAILFACTFLNVSIFSQYYTDNLKQEGIVRQLSIKSAEIQATRLMFKDEARRFNARGRDLYPYEYAGFLQSALPGRTFELVSGGEFPCPIDDQERGALIRITSSHGRLRTIATGNAGIRLSIENIDLCDGGWWRD